mgnify:CR=1 FL=1
MCNNDGNIIDDLIVYKLNNKNLLLVVNASNTQNILDWMKSHQDNYDLNISLQNNTDSLIAVQGPNSRQILNEILNINLDIKFISIGQATFAVRNIANI